MIELDDLNLARLIIQLDGGANLQSAGGLMVYRSFPPINDTPVQLLVAGHLTTDRRHRLLHALDRLEREYSLPWREGVCLMVHGWYERFEDAIASRMLMSLGTSINEAEDPLRNPGDFTEQELADRSIYTGALDVVSLIALPRLLDFYENQVESIIAGHVGRVRSDKDHWQNYQEIVLSHDPLAVEPRITYQTMTWITLWHEGEIDVPEPRFKRTERFGHGPLDVPRVTQQKDGFVSFSFMEENIFRRSGNSWTVRYRGHEQTIRSRTGMEYIQSALSRPNKELDVVSLVTKGQSSAAERGSGAVVAQDGLTNEDGAPLETLDEETKHQLKQRLVAITEERAQAQTKGDANKEEELDAEVESIRKSVAAQTFLGKSKFVGGTRGKAQDTVRQAIKRSIADLEGPIRRHLLEAITVDRHAVVYRPADDILWST
jgi:hypothetical protein